MLLLRTRRSGAADARRSRRVHDWAGQGRHATWLELFFDLVFVVAVARLGYLLHEDHSAGGILTAAGLFVAIWWAWISFTYFADLFDEDSLRDRLAQLAAMLGAAVLAVTISGGVGDDSHVFALTLAAMFALLALLYADAGRTAPRARELCRWYVLGSSAGAALWAVSVLVPTPARYVVWAVALLVNAAISGPIAYSRITEAPHQVSHMPERFGLFTIVVLGEAVLAVVNSLEDAGGRGEMTVAAVAGFVIAASIWWVYFDQFDDAAIDRAIEGGRSAQVRSFLYGYGHLLVYAAIVATGVGVELAVEEASHDGSADPLLGIGVTAVIAGFLVISAGIGRFATPAILAAKVGLAVASLAVTVADVPASTAVVVVAALWVGLIVLEALRPQATPA